MRHKWLTYYGGFAYSTSLNGRVMLLLLGHDKAEATERYYECVERHSELTALDDSMIAEGGSEEDVVDNDVRAELHEYRSAVAYEVRLGESSKM